MHTNSAVSPPLAVSSDSHDSHGIARVRAVVALLWAAAIGIAAGDANTDLSVGLALLLTAYPVIDVVASLTEAAMRGAATRRLRINAAVSSLAVAGLAGAAFGSDVSAVLAVFGSWAIVSGLIQLAGALQRRRTGTRETPMLISGGLSAVAGAWFIAASGGDHPSLSVLAGYAAIGAVLLLIWSRPSSNAS